MELIYQQIEIILKRQQKNDHLTCRYPLTYCSGTFIANFEQIAQIDCPRVFIANFVHIAHIVLVSLLLTLNELYILFYCLY